VKPCSRWLPVSSARSCIPTSPKPLRSGALVARAAGELRTVTTRAAGSRSSIWISQRAPSACRPALASASWTMRYVASWAKGPMLHPSGCPSGESRTVTATSRPPSMTTLTRSGIPVKDSTRIPAGSSSALASLSRRSPTKLRKSRSTAVLWWRNSSTAWSSRAERDSLRVATRVATISGTPIKEAPCSSAAPTACPTGTWVFSPATRCLAVTVKKTTVSRGQARCRGRDIAKVYTAISVAIDVSPRAGPIPSAAPIGTAATTVAVTVPTCWRRHTRAMD